LGWLGNKPLHVVVALNEENEDCIVITAYHPDSKHFKKDYKTRKDENKKK